MRPRTQFKTVAGFAKAVALCEKKGLKMRVDPAEGMIIWENAKEEEKFTIAWTQKGRKYY